MMNNELNEVLLAKLRSELRKDDIKLWIEPYSNSDGSQSVQFEALAMTYSNRAKAPQDQVFFHMEHLRVHSLQRLQQNSQFKATGIATLRLKFFPKSFAVNDLSFIETKLDISGKDLVDILLSKLELDCDLLKLICNGKNITLSDSLITQNIGHNKTILCMVFSSEHRDSAKEAEKQMAALRKTRRGAELLASSSTSLSNRYDPQITDQNGRSIDLPDAEKSALTIALSLHEKGRSVLKKKKYSFALLFLLEADAEFQQCSSTILGLVDNFAILCLDISWCYLCLKNLEALPDAAMKLKTCEEHFKKSYGESLQRLLTIKGSSGHEVALFVRLYLLQGVVNYYKGDYKTSNDLLNKALGYSSTIKVDEEKMLELMALGFTGVESRLSLRACDGNIASASRYAFKKRDEKQKIKKDEKEKSRKRKLARVLGKCANGDDINVDLYEKMTMQFGFDRHLAAEALKQSDNSLDKAIEILQDNADLLQIPSKKEVTDTLIQQVSSIGFDPASAEAALLHFGGIVEEALEYLMSNEGVVPPDWLHDLQHKVGKKATSSKRSSMTEADQDAVRKLAKVVDHDDEEYLDISLDEELEFISHYLALVRSVLE